jgi:glyoxylate/hydroxypyruvate reductase A
MALAILIADRDVRTLQANLQERLPGNPDIWIYPDIPHPEQVEMALVWKHPSGSLRQFPNLKCIQSFGAGVEHLLNDRDLPDSIPLARIVQNAMTVSMRNYIGMAALSIHKRMDFYREAQKRQQWQQPDPVELPLRIGILGMGVLGSASAHFLADMGFYVKGYSQSPKEIPNIPCLDAQRISLPDFVRDVNVLVCLLPLTPQTESVLNYALFREMPKGSYLINAARGGHLVEEDLLSALQEGLLAGAYLDVFREEPLPAGHPFWTHPGIVITPHSSSVTNADEALEIIVENYRRMQAGQPLLYPVERKKGY